MNCLKKVYCRVFQICFRADIAVITNVGTSHIGELGSRENILKAKLEILEGMDKIPKVLEKFDYNKVLIVTDKGITEVGLGKQLTDILEKADISYEYYDNTVANPTVSSVEEAKDKYIEGGCQAIVALGGGSSMDCAKAAGARVVKPNQPVSKMKGILKIR